MQSHKEEERGTLLSCETLFMAGNVNAEPATADLAWAGRRLRSGVEDPRDGTDYSEEAIPERDPAYRLPDATLYETRTVEHLPPASRLALARRLQQLGMSPTRAALVASL